MNLSKSAQHAASWLHLFWLALFGCASVCVFRGHFPWSSPTPVDHVGDTLLKIQREGRGVSHEFVLVQHAGSSPTSSVNKYHTY